MTSCKDRNNGATTDVGRKTDCISSRDAHDTSTELGMLRSEALSKAPNDFGIDIIGTPEQQTVREREGALEELFGTKHAEMAMGLLSHCLNVLAASEASDEIPSNDQRQFMLATVAEIEPRDGIERMLAVQMAATHVAMMRAGNMLAHATQLPQFDAHERAFNKLARTYTAQMEALRKHRNGGKQTVTVQHVTVADGGQAIVGNVQTGGRGSDGK